MNAPQDPRIWQGIRAHLDELGSVATVSPIGVILDRRRSRPPVRAIAGLVGAGAIGLVIGLLLPALRPVSAPIAGETPRSSSAPATLAALPTAAPIDLAELIGHTYVAVGVTEAGQPVAIVPETRLVLGFGNASQFGASAGCNGMGGGYQIKDGRLTTQGVYITMKACGGELGRQESWYYLFLKSGPTIRLDTTGLVLTGGDVVVTYVDEPSSAGTPPAPSASTVSEDVLARERRLLPTLDLLSELPGFQVGGLDPDPKVNGVFVYWKGEFGPEAQAVVEEANRRGIVVNVVSVAYSYDELREIAGPLVEALAAKGIETEGYSIGDDTIKVWGRALDESADLRRAAEDIAADILPPDLRFAIITSPGPAVLLPART